MPQDSLTQRLLSLEHRYLRWHRQDHQDPQTVLLLAYMPALGYAVHMTPVHEALHRGGFKVVVATHGPNLDLLRHSPHIHQLLETPDPMQDLPGAVLSLRRQLRARKLFPQAVLTGPQDARTRIGLLGALGCAGWRGGYTMQPRLYTAPLLYDRGLSRVNNNLRLAALLHCNTDACEPRVFFSAPQAAAARALLPAAPVLAVVTGVSGGLPTSWHDDRWAAVVRYAQNELGYAIVYLGTARDTPGINRIQALAGGVGTSLAGRTGVGELAAVLAQCDLCVSLMTGTLHVARAVGTPTIALGLAWEKPLEWVSPDQPHVRLLRGPDAPKSPEYRLDDLTAEAVIAELVSMAKLFPPSAAARAKRTSRSLSKPGHESTTPSRSFPS